MLRLRENLGGAAMNRVHCEARAWLLSARNWAVVHLSPRQIRRRRVRKRLAAEFLKGEGLEIGALHMPLSVPAEARVRYVDYKPTDELRVDYDGGYRLLSLAPVSIVDDGESLRSVESGSVDFLIANHVLEHCENPVATLARWLEVLRPGGILFAAVPDKRYTFDRGRPLTTTEHVVRDYRQGPAWSRDHHFEEYTRYVLRPAADRLDQRVAKLKDDNVRIHFHVWTAESFVEFLDRCQVEFGFPFVLEALKPVTNEFIVILRKVPGSYRVSLALPASSPGV
jgi:predicted SAM-dependent methyltransferase